MNVIGYVAKFATSPSNGVGIYSKRREKICLPSLRLVFSVLSPLQNSEGNHLSRAVKYTGVGKFCDFLSLAIPASGVMDLTKFLLPYFGRHANLYHSLSNHVDIYKGTDRNLGARPQ